MNHRSIALSFIVSLAVLGLRPPSTLGQSVDSAKPGGRPLTLREAVALGLENNPTHKASEKTLTAARWETRKSYLNLLPRVAVNMDYARLDNSTVRRANVFVDVGRNLVRTFAPDQDPNDIRPNAWRDTYGTSIQVLQPIYNGGLELAAISASEASERQAQFNVETSRQETIFNIYRAYLNALRAQEMVKLAEENRVSTRNHAERAQKMLDAGLRSRTDVLRWEVQLAEAEGNLIQARNGLELARAALKEVMGVSFDEHFQLEPVTSEVFEAEIPEEDQVQTLENHHPGIKALEAGVDAAHAGVRVARASFQPHVNLVYNYAWEKNGTPKLDSFTTWNAAVSLSLPIFSSFSDFAGYKKAQAQVRQMQNSAAALNRGVRLQLIQANGNVKSAQQRAVVANKGERLAEENLSILTRKYNLGLVSNIDFIDGQVALTSARAKAISARYDYLLALADQSRALGILK